MEHNPAKRIIFVSLIVLLFLIALFGGHLWNENQDEWRKQHDGVPALLPSPTSYPQLDPAESQARINELFQTNGGCRFPCWWGIVPGKTTWKETHAFLSPFMENGTAQFINDDGTVFALPYYNVRSDRGPAASIEEVIHVDDLVFGLRIEDVHPANLSNLKLSSIFQMYDRPAEIYIRSPHSDRGDGSCQGEFELFLYYPADHFAVRYRYLWYAMNRPIQVCGLDQPDLAEFYLWDPAFDYASFEEAIKLIGWYPQEKIVPVEQATSWTSETFYQAFRS
jgi:hypothetical protein